ncbi:MAG: Lrp/AsnC family transcriptional regulator [Desulfovibrio sp.]
MNDSSSIDEINRQILEILRTDARTPNAEIARQVGLTTSAVHERVRKLEARGVIRGYAAVLDADALGLKLLSFVGVRIAPHREAMNVARALSAAHGVEEVFHMAGEECFLAKVRCADTRELEQVLLALNDIPAVVSTRTVIALRPVKESPGPLLPQSTQGDET